MAKPSATAASAGNAADVAVGAATRLSHSEPPQGGDISFGTPTAATFTSPAPQATSGSSALPLLLVIVLGLLLGYAGVRLRHHHLRRRLEAFRQRQDVAWEEAVRQIEMERTVDTAKPSGEPLQKIGAG